MVVLTAGHIEAEPLAGDLEAAADHPGMGPEPVMRVPKVGVVILAAAHLADELEDVAIAVGKIRHQPFAEQVAHFERQAQQHIAGVPHAGCRDRIEDALDLGIVDRGDDRRHQQSKPARRP